LEKFERISKKIVNCLLAPLRGARNSSAAPPPAALPKKSARTDNFLLRNCLKEKRKNFKELFINLNGRPGCSQFLAVLPETAIKNRKEYN